MSHPAAPLLVQQLHYAAWPTPFRDGQAECAAQAGLRLGRAIGAAARRHVERGGIDEHVLAATLNSPLTSDPAAQRDAFRAALAASAGAMPSCQINAYECIGWALALRHTALKAGATGRPRRLLLQIADADIHGLRATWDTRSYGRARFGVTSLVIDVAPGAVVEVGSAPVERSMMKFAATLRRWAQATPDGTLALPFFPEPARQAMRRAIPGLAALADGHDAHGHCFGSDPWLAIALARQEGGAARKFVAGSLALNGYFGVTALALAEHADCSARVLQ